MSKSSKPTPIALPNDLDASIQSACELSGLSKQDVMRLAMRIGLAEMAAIDYRLPEAVTAAAKETGRDYQSWVNSQMKPTEPQLPLKGDMIDLKKSDSQTSNVRKMTPPTKTAADTKTTDKAS